MDDKTEERMNNAESANMRKSVNSFVGGRRKTKYLIATENAVSTTIDDSIHSSECLGICNSHRFSCTSVGRHTYNIAESDKKRNESLKYLNGRSAENDMSTFCKSDFFHLSSVIFSLPVIDLVSIELTIINDSFH